MHKISVLLITMPLILLFTANCKDQRPKSPMPMVDGNTKTMILYIGTYTENESHVEGKATGVYLYRLNESEGTLAYLSVSPPTVNPSYVAVHPSGNWIYTVNETAKASGNPGSISAFRLRDHGTKMEYLHSVPSEGDYPCYIQVDHSGKFVIAANYGSGTVAMWPINKDGSLGPVVSTDQHTGKGPTSRQESAHAHMITPSPDNRFVYSCDLGTDMIYIYRLDTLDRKLLPAGNPYHTLPGAGPRHLTFHPKGKYAFVINELNGTIECLKVDSLKGTLTRLQVVPTVNDGNGQDAACADIHITPSGHYLYASNRGSYNNIAMFSIEEQTGELTLIGHQDVKGRTPRNFVIDPTGTYLLVANQDSDNVVTFRIDPASGKLIDIGVQANIPTPVCLKFLK